MEIEIFRDIPNYEGIYQISNLGNVKSLNYNKTGKEKLLKPTKNVFGYLYVNLFKDKRHKMYRVHRLVALTFIPNPNKLKEINHKDENPLNNCVHILEWCDRKYNNTYGNRIKKSIQTRRINDPNNESYKKMIETRRINDPNNEWCKKAIETKRINNLLGEKPIIQYTKEGVELGIYSGTREAERQTGIPHSNISYCCKGRYKSAGGFIWKYAI